MDALFPLVGETQVFLLRARPADYPVFLTAKGEEKFYIRAGNASQPLTISEAARYIGRRFPAA